MSVDGAAVARDKLLLTVEETADALGIGRSHLFKILASGEIASVKVGRLRRVPRAELERYVDSLPRSRPSDADR